MRQLAWNLYAVGILLGALTLGFLGRDAFEWCECMFVIEWFKYLP